jgi:hypothetical protein
MQGRAGEERDGEAAGSRVHAWTSTPQRARTSVDWRLACGAAARQELPWSSVGAILVASLSQLKHWLPPPVPPGRVATLRHGPALDHNFPSSQACIESRENAVSEVPAHFSPPLHALLPHTCTSARASASVSVRESATTTTPSPLSHTTREKGPLWMSGDLR